MTMSDWTSWQVAVTPVSATSVLSTDFDGADGQPWPSPWVTSKVGGTTGGAVDLQSNRGRLRAHDGSYRTARAATDGLTAANVDLTATVRFPSVAEQYLKVWLRTSGGWQTSKHYNAVNGYYLYAGMGYGGNNEIRFGRTVDSVDTSLQGSTIAGTFQADTDYQIRVRADGTLLRAKMWVGTEPDWQLSVTDFVHTSGSFGTSLLSGGSSGARQASFDTFTVDLLDAGAVGVSNWTAWLEATTSASPETEWWVASDGSWRPAELRTLTS